MQGFFLRSKFGSRGFQFHRRFTVGLYLHNDVRVMHTWFSYCMKSHSVTTTMADWELNCPFASQFSTNRADEDLFSAKVPTLN